MKKIFIHHDKAKPRTALLRKDIPVKSPDTVPLNFYGFGYLKQRLATSRAKTLNGIGKFLQQEWSQIPEHTVKKVFNE